MVFILYKFLVIRLDNYLFPGNKSFILSLIFLLNTGHDPVNRILETILNIICFKLWNGVNQIYISTSSHLSLVMYIRNDPILGSSNCLRRGFIDWCCLVPRNSGAFSLKLPLLIISLSSWWCPKTTSALESSILRMSSSEWSTR